LTLPAIHSLWIGERLNRLHRACLKSFLLHGHKVILHVYQNVENIPEGIDICDANDLIHESEIFRHRSGSLGLFSDIFRFKILLENDGVMWVDTDVFCLRPFDFKDKYIIGANSDDNGNLYINGCVLRIPSDSPLLDKLFRLWRHPEDALNFVPHNKVRLIKLLLWFGIRSSISQYPFAVAASSGFLYYMTRLKLLDMLKIPHPFEPLSTHELFEDKFKLEYFLKEGNYSFHFFQSLANERFIDKPEPDSAYDWCLLQTGEHPLLEPAELKPEIDITPGK